MSTTRYSNPQILIHWLVALLVGIAYVTSGHPEHAKTDFDKLLIEIHITTGLLVAFLVLLRLPLRLFAGVPPVENADSPSGKLAHWVHLIFYGLMAGVPLLGWVTLSAQIPDYQLFGYALPLWAVPESWEHNLGEVHQLLGNAFVILAGLHAAAGLLHHYLAGDGTLKRMLPFLK